MPDQREPDGRHIVVDGRRWRASDPAIPEALRAELVAELMSARRAVGAKQRDARPRVQDAKVALGERGQPWWESVSGHGRDERTAAAVRSLLRHRSPESSICPSDVARVVGGTSWRSAMDDVRRVVHGMQRDGVVRITQRDEEIDLAQARGPVRIRRGPGWA